MIPLAHARSARHESSETVVGPSGNTARSARVEALAPSRSYFSCAFGAHSPSPGSLRSPTSPLRGEEINRAFLRGLSSYGVLRTFGVGLLLTESVSILQPSLSFFHIQT